MDSLLLKICLYIQLNGEACDKALLGAYTNSTLQKEYSQSINYSEKIIKNYVEDNKSWVYPGIVLGSGVDMYQKKEIRVSTPLRPLCDSLNIDLKGNGDDSIGLSWKWEF